MALICTSWDEWLDEVTEDIEEWENRQEKRCKEYAWYDPRGWFCWFVTIAVKVVRTIVVTAAGWITHTLCVWILTLWDLFKNILSGLWDVLVGIVTLDWRRIVDGLIKIGLGTVLGLVRLGRIFFLGDAIDYFTGKIHRMQLRDHVRDLLEAKYSGETLDQIKEAIGLDHGAFGLEVHCTALRCTLDSDTPSPTDPSVSNLAALHSSGAINLYELCGFEFNEGFGNRKRYKTLKKEEVLGGGGGGEFDNPISKQELDAYIASKGAEGPSFTIFSMRDQVLADKLEAAEDKGRQLGLIIKWSKRDIAITKAAHIVHDETKDTQFDLLVNVVGRTSKKSDPSAARAELCRPVAVGVFRYAGALRGLASPLDNTACGLTGEDASGVTFIDNIPDLIWKYVPIHELGHYFGLCHVDGIDRIMVSSKEKSLWSWSVIPNLYLKGEPHFTNDEAMAVWDHIVANFPPTCLGARG